LLFSFVIVKYYLITKNTFRYYARRIVINNTLGVIELEKKQIIKDIVFVGQNWESNREKAEEKMAGLLSGFSLCQQCNNDNDGDIFWVIEEIKSGILIKRCDTNLFSVCSLKCLLDRGLNRKAYYSVVARTGSGKVFSTGFHGLNATALNDFARCICGG